MQLPLSRVGLAVALLLLGACADTSGPKDDGELASRRGGPAGIPEDSPVRDVVRSAGMLAAPTASAEVAPANSNESIEEEVTEYYPYPTFAVVRTQGSVVINHNGLPGWEDLANTYLGTFSSAGWFDGWSAGSCSGNIS